MTELLVILEYNDEDQLTSLTSLVKQLQEFQQYEVAIYIVTRLTCLIQNVIYYTPNNHRRYNYTIDVWNILQTNKNKYDLFYYGFHDYLLTESHLNNFTEYCKILPITYLPGLLPYEVTQGGDLCYITATPTTHHWVPESLCQFNDKWFASFTNTYQGGILLSRSHLIKALIDPSIRYIVRGIKHLNKPGNILNIYTDSLFQKIICLSDWKDNSIHHFTNRRILGWVDTVYATRTRQPIFPNQSEPIGISEITMKNQVKQLFRQGTNYLDKEPII